MQTVGTCSICQGPVTVPDFWGGSVPPVPSCARCGATTKQPYGPVIPMVPSEQSGVTKQAIGSSWKQPVIE